MPLCQQTQYFLGFPLKSIQDLAMIKSAFTDDLHLRITISIIHQFCLGDLLPYLLDPIYPTACFPPFYLLTIDSFLLLLLIIFVLRLIDSVIIIIIIIVYVSVCSFRLFLLSLHHFL